MFICFSKGLIIIELFISMIALSVMMFLCVNQIISLVVSGSRIRIGSQCFLFYRDLR